MRVRSVSVGQVTDTGTNKRVPEATHDVYTRTDTLSITPENPDPYLCVVSRIHSTVALLRICRLHRIMDRVLGDYCLIPCPPGARCREPRFAALLPGRPFPRPSMNSRQGLLQGLTRRESKPCHYTFHFIIERNGPFRYAFHRKQ